MKTTSHSEKMIITTRASFMGRVISGLKATLFMALLGVAWQAFDTLKTAKDTLKTADAVIAALPSQVDSEITVAGIGLGGKIDKALAAAQSTVNAQGNSIRKAAVFEIRATRKEIADQTAAAIILADRRAGDGLLVLNHHAEKIEDQIDDSNAIIFGVAKPAHDVLSQLSAAMPDLLNHEKVIGFEVAKATQGMGATLPQIIVRADKLTGHAEHIANTLDLLITHTEKHRPWWMRLLRIGPEEKR